MKKTIIKEIRKEVETATINLYPDRQSALEDGDVNKAREKAGEAEKLYRQAELDAIKTNYLDETRKLLKRAEQMDVKDRAPKTLLNAQQLLKQAEKELNDNRYDTDVARGLAQQAKYQAKHAIYLSKAIKQMKDKDQSWEDLMLASEKPLAQIAGKANLDDSFDTGLGYTDSYGGDAQNLQLSKERAEAVKQYLLANTKLKASRLIVPGLFPPNA